MPRTSRFQGASCSCFLLEHFLDSQFGDVGLLLFYGFELMDWRGQQSIPENLGQNGGACRRKSLFCREKRVRCVDIQSFTQLKPLRTLESLELTQSVGFHSCEGAVERYTSLRVLVTYCNSAMG